MADEIGLPFLEVIDHGTLGVFRVTFFECVENAHMFFQFVFQTLRRGAQLSETSVQ